MTWFCSDPTDAQRRAAVALKGELTRLAGDGGLTVAECKTAVRGHPEFNSEYISDHKLKGRCEDLVDWTKQFRDSCRTQTFWLNWCYPENPVSFAPGDLDERVAVACREREAAINAAMQRYNSEHREYRCFPAETYVFTERGAVTIGELSKLVKAGAAVKIAGRNDRTGAVEYHTVAKVIAEPPQPSILDITYTTAAGQTAKISVTGNHPLAGCDGAQAAYSAADTITRGALLCAGGQGAATVQSVESRPFSGAALYDISIADGDHNYLVSETPDMDRAVTGHNKYF